IDSRRDVDGRDLFNLGPQNGGLLKNGDGVQVDDAEDALVIVLNPDPILEGAQLVADVQIAGRLHPGEDSCFHGRGNGGTLIVSNFEVTVEKLVYGGDGLARLD